MPNQQHAVDSFIMSTKVEEEEKHFVFKFPKFRQFHRFMKKQVFEFEMGNRFGAQHKWLFTLSEYDWSDNNIDPYFGAYIQRKSESPENEVAQFFIKLKNGEITHTANGSLIDYKYSDDFNHYQENAIRLFSLNEQSLEEVLSGDDLVIELTFRVYNIYPNSIENLTLDDKLNNYSTKFRQKFEIDMLSCSKDVNDEKVKIFAKDGEEFSVNRKTLCARYYMFEKMFNKETGMIEARDGTAQLPDISFATLEVILKYITEAQLHPNWKNDEILEELCFFAHQWDLKDLNEFLEVALVDLCTPANSFRMACLASKLGWKKGEQLCLDYFKRNVNSLDVIDWKGTPASEEEESNSPKRRRSNSGNAINTSNTS